VKIGKKEGFTSHGERRRKEKALHLRGSLLGVQKPSGLEGRWSGQIGALAVAPFSGESGL